MDKPTVDRAIFEAFFIGGYSVAAQNGRIEMNVYKQYEQFFRSLDQGAPLIAFCHFIETYFGSKDDFIERLNGEEIISITNLLFYLRNAFIHCGWDISKLNFENQERKIRQFCDSGGTYSPVPVFNLTIDENNRVHIEGLMAICMAVVNSLQPDISEDS